MKKQILSLLLVCAVLLAGCAGAAPAAGKKQAEAPVLTVCAEFEYGLESMGETFFHQLYPETEARFEFVQFPDDWGERDQFYLKLQTEIMSGRGPDIFILTLTRRTA